MEDEARKPQEPASTGNGEDGTDEQERSQVDGARARATRKEMEEAMFREGGNMGSGGARD